MPGLGVFCRGEGGEGLPIAIGRRPIFDEHGFQNLASRINFLGGLADNRCRHNRCHGLTQGAGFNGMGVVGNAVAIRQNDIDFDAGPAKGAS